VSTEQAEDLVSGLFTAGIKKFFLVQHPRGNLGWRSGVLVRTTRLVHSANDSWSFFVDKGCWMVPALAFHFKHWHLC